MHHYRYGLTLPYFHVGFVRCNVTRAPLKQHSTHTTPQFSEFRELVTPHHCRCDGQTTAAARVSSGARARESMSIWRGCQLGQHRAAAVLLAIGSDIMGPVVHERRVTELLMTAAVVPGRRPRGPGRDYPQPCGSHFGRADTGIQRKASSDERSISLEQVA
jgi:methyl coenzyme M reductase alpha subunit